MNQKKEEVVEKDISPNYVPEKAKNKRKHFIAYFALFIIVILIVGGILVSTKDDMTYKLITNCEINIKNNLSSPSSFKPISVRVMDFGRTQEADTFINKSMTDYSKGLMRDEGYLAKSLFVTLEFDSKNTYNVDVRNIGVCEYNTLYKDSHTMTPNLTVVAIGGRTVSDKNGDPLHFLMTTKDISMLSSSFPVFMSKIKYLMVDVEELE